MRNSILAPSAQRPAPSLSRVSAHRSIFRVVRLPAFGVVALLALLMGAVSSPATALAAAPASCPPAISTGGGTCVSGPVHLTVQEQSVLAMKTALAQEYAGVRAGRISYAQYKRDLSGFMARYAGPTHSVNFRQPLCIINPNTGQCIVASGQVSLTQQTPVSYTHLTLPTILRV